MIYYDSAKINSQIIRFLSKGKGILYVSRSRRGDFH